MLNAGEAVGIQTRPHLICGVFLLGCTVKITICIPSLQRLVKSVKSVILKMIKLVGIMRYNVVHTE